MHVLHKFFIQCRVFYMCNPFVIIVIILVTIVLLIALMSHMHAVKSVGLTA